MKSIIIIIIVVLSLLTCSSIKDKRNSKQKIVSIDSIIVGEKIKSLLGKEIIKTLSYPDSVIFNKILIEEINDTIKNEKYTVNKLKRIKTLSKFYKNILSYIVTSDSTYIWTDLKIKHSFEPEMTFVFLKDSAKVNVIYSKNSNQLGYRYKDFFKTIYIRNNSLIDNFFNIMRLQEKKIDSVIKKDTILINKDTINIKNK